MSKILRKRILQKISLTLLWCLFLQINASATSIKSSHPIMEHHFSNSINNRVDRFASKFADVSGVVKDASGGPLPGVGVKVKGTTNAVSTNGEGRFTLRNVTPGAIIEFTSIGMKTQEVVYTGQNNIEVVLQEDAKGLDEVVVTAYGGAQKRSNVTAAISQISAAEIMKSPTPNPTNALIGKLPGLLAVQSGGQPGADASTLRVRGVATYGNSAAIIVVDGIERPSFADVDANEIETITALKDAASTAVYGLRGANGVIVITTKAGKLGTPKVTYTGNVAAQTYTGLAVGLPAYENASLLNLATQNDNYLLTPRNKKPNPFTAEDLQKFQDGSDPYGHPNVQWFDYLTRKYAPQTQHNISIRGGTKIAKYFVSAGYAFQDGIFKKFDSPFGINTVPNFNRYNFRSNIDLNLSRDLSVGIRLGGRFSNRYQPAGLLSSSAFSYDTIEGMISRILQTPSYAFPVTLPDGRIAANPNVGTNIWSPYGVLTRYGTRNDDNNTIESTFNINYKLDFITKGLSFRTNFGYDSYYVNVERRNANWASYIYNAATGTATLSSDTRNRDEPLGAILGVTGGNTTSNLQTGFNYDRTFGKHSVSALVLGTRQLTRTTGETVFTAPPRAFQSLVGSLDYGFDDRYRLSFSAGYNGSENFAEGLRYGFFPAVAGSWTLTSEPFWKKNNTLTYLKVRGSYGLVGNDRISDNRFLFLTSYSPHDAQQFGTPTAPTNYQTLWIPNDPNALGNDAVTWETGTKRNIGLEARFLKDALKLNADVFDETRKDILTRSLSGSALFGHLYPNLNKGIVYNKGYEIELDYQGNKGQFIFGLNAQVSYNKNRILENDEPDGLPDGDRGKGKSVGQYIGYLNDGFYQSADDIANSVRPQGIDVIPGDLKFKDLNGDGVITTLDRTSIGYTPNPEYVYSFTPRLTYNGISLSVQFQGVANVSSNVILTEQNNGQQMYPHLLNSWTPQNAATATWPAIHLRGYQGLNYQLNDFILQNAAYLKIRNVELSYQLPKKWSQSLRLNNVRLYVNGTNLYTWTKFKMYVDPENLNVVNQAFPLQSLYPSQRVYNFGVNIDF